MKFYDSNDAASFYFRTISQSDFSSLTPLNVPTEEHENILDENNQRKLV